MSKSKMRFLIAAIFFAACSIPSAVFANATFDMVAFEGNEQVAAGAWFYQIYLGDPDNGNQCANSTTRFPSWASITVISLPPPFSGSKSRTRWVTTCKDGDYITFKFKIELTKCALWICKSSHPHSFVRKSGLTYSTRYIKGGQLYVTLNPDQGFCHLTPSQGRACLVPKKALSFRYVNVEWRP